MKTKDLADWLGVATGTIRSWTSGEFRRYLSHTAQGGQGRTRNFTETDARIIALVAALKDQGTPKNEIHTTLQRLQAEDWQDLPPMPAAPPGHGPVPMVSKDAAETALSTQRASLLRQVAILEERNERLEAQLADAHADNAKIQTELAQTRETLGELRGQLQALKVERQPAAYWLRLLALVVVVLLIVAAAVVVLVLVVR